MFFLSPEDYFQNQPFQEYHQSVKQLRSGSARRFVGPDLGPNCLQRLSADGTSRQRIKQLFFSHAVRCNFERL